MKIKLKHITIIICSIILIGCTESNNEIIVNNNNPHFGPKQDSVTEELKTSTVNENELEHYFPEKSEVINSKHSIDLLYQSWAHDSSDYEYAFRIDENGFHQGSSRSGYYTVPFIIKFDSIEVFEYLGGPNGSTTSQGVITKLTKDSLVISYYTGGNSIGRYVKHKE
jgi:hypothetical protein